MGLKKESESWNEYWANFVIEINKWDSMGVIEGAKFMKNPETKKTFEFEE